MILLIRFLVVRIFCDNDKIISHWICLSWNIMPLLYIKKWLLGFSYFRIPHSAFNPLSWHGVDFWFNSCSQSMRSRPCSISFSSYFSLAILSTSVDQISSREFRVSFSFRKGRTGKKKRVYKTWIILQIRFCVHSTWNSTVKMLANRFPITLWLWL